MDVDFSASNSLRWEDLVRAPRQEVTLDVCIGTRTDKEFTWFFYAELDTMSKWHNWIPCQKKVVGFHSVAVLRKIITLHEVLCFLLFWQKKKWRKPDGTHSSQWVLSVSVCKRIGGSVSLFRGMELPDGSVDLASMGFAGWVSGFLQQQPYTDVWNRLCHRFFCKESITCEHTLRSVPSHFCHCFIIGIT